MNFIRHCILYSKIICLREKEIKHNQTFKKKKRYFQKPEPQRMSTKTKLTFPNYLPD